MAPAATASVADTKQKLKETSALEGISGLLNWDEMVTMPEGAAEARAAQKSALAGILHERHTDPAIGGLLAKLQAGGGDALKVAGFDAYQQAVVREAARGYRKATAITKELAQAEAELESWGYLTWVKARQDNDFAAFAPVLKEWVGLRRQRAASIDPAKDAYDVLLDDYEPGLTAAWLDEVFGQVKAGLVPLLADVRTRGVTPDDAWLKGDYDTGKQVREGGVHPFTGGTHPTDVRMTTRFKQADLTEGLTGAIHETGHVLYEQARAGAACAPRAPRRGARGRAATKSTMACPSATPTAWSLLWERMVGLSKPFAAYLLPLLHEAFPQQLPRDKTAGDLYAALNVVRHPSLIRIEADEVTYPLHIVLRYELERGLVDGSVEVDDLPALWNQAGGASRSPVMRPLATVGSLYPSGDELMVSVTGAPLDPSFFLTYLRDKYSEIYRL
eukprot:scaffold4.g4883.t1